MSFQIQYPFGSTHAHGIAFCNGTNCPYQSHKANPLNPILLESSDPKFKTHSPKYPTLIIQSPKYPSILVLLLPRPSSLSHEAESAIRSFEIPSNLRRFTGKNPQKFELSNQNCRIPWPISSNSRGFGGELWNLLCLVPSWGFFGVFWLNMRLGFGELGFHGVR
ncbi:hypothetical protein AKJ16_DCAP10163 [Drosera capensis]